VLERIASLEEIETHWSINDLAEANEVLDYRDALRSAEMERAKQRR